jgi:hypothetical protein
MLAGLGSGSAAAAGNRKLVEGTVYDTTCLATTCQPECPPPPHCGPITAQSGAAIVCPLAQRRIIACPLANKAAAEISPPVCLPESGCFTYPVYSGEGATINVRRRGSAKVIANLQVVDGHFEIRLGAGEYVLHPYLPEESCWAGDSTTLKVYPRWKGPVSTDVDVHDTCVAHPGAAK